MRVFQRAAGRVLTIQLDRMREIVEYWSVGDVLNCTECRIALVLFQQGDVRGRKIRFLGKFFLRHPPLGATEPNCITDVHSALSITPKN